MSTQQLQYKGSRSLRHRLILSLLSSRPLRITSIRPLSSPPGLTPYELSFIRLLSKITLGTKVTISLTGTEILFIPGRLNPPQDPVEHDCVERSVGWFLEPIIAIAALGKRPLKLVLKGVTTDPYGPSVDVLRLSLLPTLALFLPHESRPALELKIEKRGHLPLGGGEVYFSCPCVRKYLSGVSIIASGRVSKIRGIAHTTRTSPAFATRLVNAARGVLNRYIPDVYIYTDSMKGASAGLSPGYGITLLSTSTTGTLHTSSRSSHPSTPAQTPEDLGTIAALELLKQISNCGCVDGGAEWLAALGLVLSGERDVGHLRIGVDPWNQTMVDVLRGVRDCWGVKMRIKKVEKAVVIARQNNGVDEASDDEEVGWDGIKDSDQGEEDHIDHMSDNSTGPGVLMDEQDESEDDYDEETGFRSQQEEHMEDKELSEMVSRSRSRQKESTSEMKTMFEYELSCLGIGYVNVNLKGQ
ncbi:18S rRNA biogenesis protein [Atractiella rhizophila]|nr:18S rRNA biogenesis protein [Atractiella rhizophila]